MLLKNKQKVKLGKIKEEADKVNPGLPVEVIDMRTYGMMDGAKVLDQALKMYEDWKNK
mgnify:CR=1 FL=1